MPSFWKVVGVTVGAIVVVGLVVGSLTWAILATRGPPPPELKPLDWWEHMVVYQIYPRSFMDSDGDGIGDLKGIAMKLEHFVDIGVDALWLCPIFVSPMVDFGYDISDFYDIHEEYGTMADFEELLEKAHSLGLKILLDFVPNHASNESEYFIRSLAREPGYEDFFVWADPVFDPNDTSRRLVPSNWISVFGGSVWEWSEIRQQYYLHQFAIEQPDFNFRDPGVIEEIKNILRFWYEKGVDGYRLDALTHLFEADPNDHGGVFPDEPLSGNMFLNPNQAGYTTEEHVRDHIKNFDVVYDWREYSDKWQKENGGNTKILLGEAFSNITVLMRYYGDGRGILGTHFPFNFDLINELSNKSSARDYVYVMKRWLTYMPAGHVANWVLGNHDQNRMPSRFRTDMVDGLNSILMLLPGVAITYQGEEIGMRDGFLSWEDTVDVQACNQANPDNYLEYSRDPARTPYQWDNTTSAGFSTNPNTWLPVADSYLEINLRTQKEAQRSHYKVYKSLTRLRKQPSLSHGSYHLQALTDNTFVLIRHLITHNTYALLFNVGQTEDTVDLSSIALLVEPLTVYTSSVHSKRETDDTLLRGEVTLQPGEALVLQAAPT